MTRYDEEILPVLGLEPSSVSRREFLRRFGGGIVITVAAGDLTALQETPARRPLVRELPDDFNAFLRIGEDGRVACLTGKVEMGQGVVTSLAQMLADELEVPLESVDMVMGDTDLCPWDMGTFGSMTTRFFGPPLRAAAAEAREVLVELAAERLGVAPERLAVEEGSVFDTSDPARRVSYAELAKGQVIARRLGRQAVLESVSDFDVVGRPVLRRDAVAKVTGTAEYAGDVRLDGMLYARVVRPPAHGAVVVSLDTSAAERVAGATVVRDGELVAVLHETPDGAERALAAVEARWEVEESDLGPDTIFDHLLKTAPRGETKEATWRPVGRRRGPRWTAATSTGTWPTRRSRPTPRSRASTADG